MDELIKINYDSERPTVNGRDLHDALQVKTAYKDRFPRMCKYGFSEGTDFCSFLSESSGGRSAVNHQLTILKHQNMELADTIAVQSQQILEMKPKASYYDVVLNCKDLISTSTIAKDYGKSAIWMNRYLHEKEVQFKQGDIWLLYQHYAQKGYTSTKAYSYPGSDGENHTKVHTYWTQKGRLFIYELMKSDGMKPLIE